MTVYAEIVFISNFFIDMFIAATALAMLKINVKITRLIVFSVAGGIVSAIYPIAGEYGVLIKIFFLPIMTPVLTKTPTIKDYSVVLLTLLGITVVLGGVVEFLICFINTTLSYEDFTYGLVPILISVSGLGIIACCGVLNKRFFKVRQKNGLIYNVTIKSGDYVKNCRAFYDSGNRVYANNGEPVIFVKEKIYNKFARASDTVEIVTAAGVKSVPVSEATVVIYFEDGKNIIYKVAAGGLNLPCEAEILLHSDMQGE